MPHTHAHASTRSGSIPPQALRSPSFGKFPVLPVSEGKKIRVIVKGQNSQDFYSQVEGTPITPTNLPFLSYITPVSGLLLLWSVRSSPRLGLWPLLPCPESSLGSETCRSRLQSRDSRGTTGDQRPLCPRVEKTSNPDYDPEPRSVTY